MPICKIGVKMQEVFEELLEKTRYLKLAGSGVHYYDNWAAVCNGGKWFKMRALAKHARVEWGVWEYLHTSIAVTCPNFSAYVRHYQAQ